MFIESFLNHYTTYLTRRYLTFKEYTRLSPPIPEKNSKYLLYIHIPFCEELCPYCSFFKVKFQPSLASNYFDALKKEIEIYHNLGYCFDSVYIGGGTPTILPNKLAEIVSFVKDTWPINQVSVETNPNHLVPQTLQILKDMGTNRLSVGVQSFNREILESIQRLEKYGSGEEIKGKLASVAGMFDTLNIDMIFNFPNQTGEMLAKDIEIIKETKVDQITYYPLMVSNGQKNNIARRCGKINYPQEKQLYKLLTKKLSDSYNQESAWCFSRKKGVIDEYIIDHDEYVGVGPGCWGYINGTMYSNTFSIEQYISMIQQNKHPVVGYKKFSYLERIRYDFLIQLLNGSLCLSHMKKKYGRSFWLYLSRELVFFLATRAIALRDNKIVLTPKGRYYWVSLMRTFFSVVGDYRDRRISLDAAP